MTPREVPTLLPPALLRAARHPVARCLLACLAATVAVAAAEPSRGIPTPCRPGR